MNSELTLEQGRERNSLGSVWGLDLNLGMLPVEPIITLRLDARARSSPRFMPLGYCVWPDLHLCRTMSHSRKGTISPASLNPQSKAGREDLRRVVDAVEELRHFEGEVR